MHLARQRRTRQIAELPGVWTSSGPETVPKLRQCPRKVMTAGGRNPGITPRTNGLGTGLKWLVERGRFDFRKKSCDQKTPQHVKERLMAILLAILHFLFGCHHVHLSRVFTLQGETYKVCFDCGAKFAYSLETMSIERRLPLTLDLTRFRIA